MNLADREKKTVLLVEESAFEGVKRVAEKVALDIEKVTGSKPEVVASLEGLDKETQVIFCATVGKSALLKKLLQDGLVDTETIAGKREVYAIKLLEKPVESFEEVMVICGSDKRGTIYGMFSLSEYIGVSPLCYWGDAEPMKREKMVIGKDIEIISKEPSVKYRGFFINDEWPCFGNWTCSHFGGFNADAYEHVFEFLLRMKGNYLWPAMWSASFPLDGPGSKNEELADIYGVVMGYSHHEPCLRASEEWDKVRGPESRYGNEWNFYTNEQGLLNYWEDALKRSGKYEKLITIGMRGERDTSMLGEHATVEENINLLKDIIRKQRKLIRENVNEDLSQVPQLLALYKEVEAYFYGDENIQGLKDWDELDGVICMLCEDNFGHMRTLPTEEIRNRKGGFGMYYHFDYHGGPISYEWVDSTPLSKTWEQMCMAYEYGIREAWIVNVGDLKLHEVPLTYFMALAYDYDKWGYSNLNSYSEYTAKWAKETFPAAGADLQEKIGRVLTDYINVNGMRRPEAQNPGIYHPCNYNEADRMLAKAEAVEALSAEVYDSLKGTEKEAYYSMIHFSAMASMNLLKMHLYAGKNGFYAKQGKPIANYYGELAKECMAKDRAYYEEFGAFRDGKWDGMQMAQHIGFTKWNEDDYRYPVLMTVEPAYKPRLKVSRKDAFETAVKNYGAPMAITVDDFCYSGCESVVLEIANDGVDSVHYQIEPQTADKALPAWLQVSAMEGTVKLQEDLVLTCDSSRLPEKKEQVRLLIKDEETCVAVDISARAVNVADLPEKTHLEKKGIIAMNAGNYFTKKDTAKGAFKVIEDYGKYGAGVKVFPSTAVFAMEEEKPLVSYRFLIEEAGEYEVELVTAPTNSVVNKQSVNVALQINEETAQKVTIVPADFKAGESGDYRWSKGVLNQERKSTVKVQLSAGVQTLSVGALEAGVVLERIIIYKQGAERKDAYLGPEDSWYRQKAAVNPLTRLDYPDVDVIRVEDTYYMVSTTMYFMPGCEILRSYDLVNWEHASYVYDVLDSTPAQKLEEEKNIYGQGMWAASLRYHKGFFYVCFVANDTHKTYLYTAPSIEGPWKKSTVEGFYHDCSILFDEDDRVYIVSGNKHIRLQELKADLSGPKEGGIDRIVVSDEGHPGLGYEGTHFYKINGKYYLFFIHSLRDQWKRVEACFVSDSLSGEFSGGDVLNDDMGYCNQGVAQGGIVDTPEGDWYAVLFQDRGAVGRIPVLIPIYWENDYPVFGVDGKIPAEFATISTRPEHKYMPLVGNDDFKEGFVFDEEPRADGRVTVQAKYDSFGFQSCWQFNHEPDLTLVKRNLEKGTVEITTDRLCKNITQAKNVLTQRMLYPKCSGEITVDISGLREGDFAGLCALQGCYGMVAVTKEDGKRYVEMRNRPAADASLAGMTKDTEEGILQEKREIQTDCIRLKVEADFEQMKDEANFFYDAGEGWKKIGISQKLYFKLDHFTGCRFGLFLFSTRECGGSVSFSDFRYR